MNIIIVSGKPGAGKGTRLSSFMEQHGEEYEILSTGQIIRSMLKQEGDLADELKSIVSSGQLVPDEMVNKLVADAISKATSENIILDGYPRTVGQATSMLQNNLVPAKLINIFVGDIVIIKRAEDRIVCSKCGESYTTNRYKPPKKEGVCDKCGSSLVKRADDDPAVVKERLRVYAESTEPIIDFFKEKGIPVVTVLGNGVNLEENFEKAMLK